jgi:putative selenate reductase
LQQIAHRHGRSLSLKFTNTLVVKNHKHVFGDELMYMSGAPLHVLAMNLVQKFRARVPLPIPISFSGGLDPHNVAAAVAMNFVPVTTCTDLLRPGGYTRLVRYLENLGAEMRLVGASNIAEFVQKYRGQGGDVHTAGLLNTPILVAEATANPRYSWERNQGVPRKIGSKLWLYDCINCDKCVPVCPNDANFSYETRPETIEYDNFELLPGGTRRIPGGKLRIMKSHQLANYADACNECGNCDVFCPEDGGPQMEKPRFFGSLETFLRDAGTNGFFIDWDTRTIHGAVGQERHELAVDAAVDLAWFRWRNAEIEIRLSDNEVLSWEPLNGNKAVSFTLDLLPYLKLKALLESISDPRRVHFANVAGLQEKYL